VILLATKLHQWFLLLSSCTCNVHETKCWLLWW